MNLHEESLPVHQQKALRELGETAQRFGFYLGGGTAVAIHLGHRESLDLDWFTQERIENPMELALDIQRQGVDLRVTSVQRGTLHGELDGVRVSFLESGYPALQPAIAWTEYRCQIATIEDLAAMKLLAVAQRGTKKDFVDVYAIGRDRLSLTDMLAFYRRRFSTDDTSRVIYSLCYFEDANPDPMPKILWAITWDEVRETIRNWVRSLSPS
jgi:hypothetical protein